MNRNFHTMKRLIEELESIEDAQSYMQSAWNSDDECAQAENDPGLQFEKDMEAEAKYNEIVDLCKTIIGENDGS